MFQGGAIHNGLHLHAHSAHNRVLRTGFLISLYAILINDPIRTLGEGDGPSEFITVVARPSVPNGIMS